MDVFWFKLSANFDKDDRVVWLEKQRNGKLAAYLYIKLYCIAARCNQGGGVFIAENKPHTAKTLANQWNFKVSQVENSLNLLLEAGLLGVVGNVFFIADWDSTQNVDKLEEIRKNTRLRQQRYRENQRLEKEKMLQASNVTVTQRNAVEIDIEKEKEKEIEIDGDGEEKIIEDYISLFNTTGFKKIKYLSSKQKEAVLNAVKEFGFEQLKESLVIASKSEFLNGKNTNGWTASFDWLIKPENVAKVLNGNYSELFSAAPTVGEALSSFDLDEFAEAAFARGFN